MGESTEEAVAGAVRAASGPLVVVGEAGHRRAAAAAATSREHVLEVPAPAEPAGWSGIGALLDACRRQAPWVRVPPALEAATTGCAVGDHLGLAADLCTLLAHLCEDRPWTVLVHDAHRIDLSSAAALSRALADAPDGVLAVATQDRSDRGLRGLPTHVAGPEDAGDAVPPVRGRIGPDGAAERVREAARRGAVLDAAAWAESAGDWPAAAARWLEGGRPQRCREAIAVAGPGPAVLEVAARLAQRVGSERERRTAVDRAVVVLDAHDPLASVRLRLVEAGARTNAADEAGAQRLVVAAADVLATVEPGPAPRVAQELLELVVSSLAVARGGDPAGLLRSSERPLARLGAGGIDVDAVQLLSAAAMTLGARDHLDAARSLIDRVIGTLDARRRFVLLAQPLATSAWLARRRGRLELALTHGSRAIELARACGWIRDERIATVEVAHVEAVHGRLDDCRRRVASLVGPGMVPRGSAQLGAVSALAVGELFADAPARAVELLEPVQQRYRGVPPPGQTAWRHNLVEAYVRTGRRADAEAVLADLVEWTSDTSSSRHQGHVAWCRGMLAPPGDHDAHFAEARRLLAGYPVVRWRADLHHLRRLLDEGRHAEAVPLAAHLESEATSSGLLAAVDQVRRLQRHSGAEVPEGGRSTRALSVDDLRVALALAEGAEVEEVAALLGSTCRKVEGVRDRVMALLGVDDPTHLGRFLQLDQVTPTPTAALVRVFGPTVVQRGDQQLLPPAGRPGVALAVVAVDGSVPVERVLDVLWPDADPAQARRRLRNVLARLRGAVGSVVERDGDRLVLAPDVEVDVRIFDRLADEALRAGADDDVLARTGDALAAWTGEPLVSWPYEDWALRERHRLVQRCVSLHVRRADVLARGGAVGAALDELEQAVALQPDARDLWERAVTLADADGWVGRARALRRRAADHDVDLV